MRSHITASVSLSIPLFARARLSSPSACLLFQGFAPLPTHHRARSHASRDASARAIATERRFDFFPIARRPDRARTDPPIPASRRPFTPIAVATHRDAWVASIRPTRPLPPPSRASKGTASNRIEIHRVASSPRTFKHRPLIAAEADIANMANGGSRVTSRGRDDEGSRSAGHLDTFVLFFDAFESDKDVFEVFCTGSR